MYLDDLINETKIIGDLKLSFFGPTAWCRATLESDANALQWEFSVQKAGSKVAICGWEFSP
jgi:hypothetical protein